MFDRAFAEWWLGRIEPYKDVPPEKLEADREVVHKQQLYNQNYRDFLNEAVLPAVEALVQVLRRHQIVHRVSTWGNQLALRIHLSWRWGELVITQSMEDCVTFDHHIVIEGEKRGDDAAQDHSHAYDLRDPLPPAVATQELQFFMGRLAQDLIEPEDGDLPPQANA